MNKTDDFTSASGIEIDSYSILIIRSCCPRPTSNTGRFTCPYPISNTQYLHQEPPHDRKSNFFD